MRARSIFALLLVLLIALPVMAQEQRGAIEGVVKDSSGAVLPGVTVEARSTAGRGVLTTVTDATGQFRFPAVSPGYFTVTASLQGFEPKKFDNVEVLLGQIKKLDFALPVGGVQESVQVTGEAPLVDVKQSARATSIRAETLDLLPKTRDFMSVVTQAAGANNEGKSAGVMIDGATTAENRYVVDGAETSNLVNGGSGKTVLPDFVEEVQVKSSGYTAEYGGATGGVINVITKSGTNNWRGNALFYLTNSKFLSTAPSGYAVGTPTLRLKLTDSNAAEYITYGKDKYSRYEPGFSFGGPIATDKAWFYAAYQPTFESISRDVVWVGDNATHETGTRKLPGQYLSANQTTQLGSKLRTRVAYNNSWSKTDGRLPAVDGSDVPGLNYKDGTKYPNQTISAQADWVVKSNFFISTRVGYYLSDASTYNVPSDPRFIFRTSTIGMAGVPTSLQRTSSAVNIPTNSVTDWDKQQRMAFQVDGTWYGSMAGQHTIKGGFQVDHIANSVNSFESAPYAQMYYGLGGSQSYRGQSGAFGYYRFRVATPSGTSRGFSTTGDVSSNNVGLFIQDAWTINNRFTVNLGLRTENETVPPFVPGLDLSTGAMPLAGAANLMPDIKFGFKDKLAPRAGFAWDVKGDGKWKAYGSWGIFYDIFKMNLSRGSFGGEKWQEYWYTLDTANWSTLFNGFDGSCLPNCPALGTRIRGPYDYRAPGAVDPAIKPMRSQELSFGLEHQLSPVLAFTARYVHKQLDRAVDDTGSFNENGEIYVIANPGFGMTQTACDATNGCNPTVALPKARRDYDAVEVGVTKNLSRNYYLRLSYQWSRLFGNFSGLDQTDENGRQSPNTGRLYDYPIMSFDGNGNDLEGPLATDRPHQVKAQLIYQFKFGTTIGVNEFIASGIPRSRELAVTAGGQYPMMYAGRLSDGRTPVWSQTDLNISHDIKLSGNRRIQVSLNIMNLLNQKTENNYFQTQNASGRYVDFTEPAFYQHNVDVAALWAATVAAHPTYQDPRYMQYNGYQFPRQARVGFKFLF